MSVSRQVQPLQCRKKICRDVFSFHTKGGNLERTKGMCSPVSWASCCIRKPWFWGLHLHLYSNLISIRIWSSGHKLLSCFLFFSRVALLMGQNIHLFPIRTFSEMTGFLQLPSRSNWEQYWKNSTWISLRNRVPHFQWLNVVSGLLEVWSQSIKTAC